MSEFKIAKKGLRIEEAEFALFGVASDLCSGYRCGARAGPGAIRKASKWFATTQCECGVELTSVNLIDLGDVAGESKDEVAERVREKIKEISGSRAKVICVGGDHYWSFEVIKSLSESRGIKRLGLIYLDAHPDILYDREEVKKSHACTVRRILELDNVRKEDVIMIGVRAAESSETRFLEKEGIRVFRVDELNDLDEQIMELLNRVDKVYISVDLDVVDAAFAFGVQNPEVGGFTSRQFLNLIKKVCGLCREKVIGFDIMELTEEYDIRSITALLGVKTLFEMTGELHERKKIV